MAWTDQTPEATDVVLSARISKGRKSVWFEIDKLPDGRYRATTGNLFGSNEFCRDRDLEYVLREIQKARIASP